MDERIGKGSCGGVERRRCCVAVVSYVSGSCIWAGVCFWGGSLACCLLGHILRGMIACKFDDCPCASAPLNLRINTRSAIQSNSA